MRPNIWLGIEVQELSHSIRMDRRAAIRYIFCVVYGMPPREEWQLEGGKTLASEIATRLSIYIGYRGLIVDAMLEWLDRRRPTARRALSAT
jgi:hypothetical protein